VFYPRYFLTQFSEIFFDPKGKKLKNLVFLGGNFPNPEVADMNSKKMILPVMGQNFFDPDHTLQGTLG